MKAHSSLRDVWGICISELPRQERFRALIGGFMRLFNLFKLSLACLLVTGMAFAQGVGTSGEIKGTVTDPSGATISSGTVTATDVDKGIKHTVTTDSDGSYRLAALQPAVYSLTVSKSGFQ